MGSTCCRLFQGRQAKHHLEWSPTLKTALRAMTADDALSGGVGGPSHRPAAPAPDTASRGAYRADGEFIVDFFAYGWIVLYLLFIFAGCLPALLRYIVVRSLF
ncbi:unnamed protein product, partial [Amoebophrya sp. A120]